MSAKEIDVLKGQIALLNSRKFDLEAWKAHTLVLIARIFGRNSEQFRLIQKLKYDYSSWSLRDTSGGAKESDPIKSKAKEVLDAAIHELSIFGVPSQPVSEEIDKLMGIFQNELTGKELHELKRIMRLSSDERKKGLTDFIKSKDKEILSNILIELLVEE